MKQPIYNTALYMRLSRDDEQQGESGSIQTQRMMLRSYAKEQNFHIVDEYIDDGWSGTNFERPGFQRMIDDIEDGKINCVITKDLSRLGRNYIMTGQYTEIYFPSKGVRYIAINDNVDTAKGESELAPFLNILNEMHARQTSKKIKAAFRTRFENGAHSVSHIPLGYLKDPDQKGHLIVDPENKWIIEKIFDMALHGAGANKITKTLVEEKVPTAGWIAYQRSGDYSHVYRDAPEERRYAWKPQRVRGILQNETYIGNSVHNKLARISFKNKNSQRVPQGEWYRIENTHEGIISKEVYNQVQELIANRRRSMKEGHPFLFAGLVRCADCGNTMRVTKQSSGRRAKYVYCSLYSLGLHECTMHFITYDVLYAYVLERLQFWAAMAEQDEDALMRHLMNASDQEQKAAQKKQATELKKAEKRKETVDGLFAKLYEDWSAGRITEYNFDMLSAKYQTEQSELAERIEVLRATMANAKQSAADAEKWVGLIRQYRDITELDVTLLNTLIEKIVVHEAVKAPDKKREQEVEIYYRFVGKIEG